MNMWPKKVLKRKLGKEKKWNPSIMVFPVIYCTITASLHPTLITSSVQISALHNHIPISTPSLPWQAREVCVPEKWAAGGGCACRELWRGCIWGSGVPLSTRGPPLQHIPQQGQHLCHLLTKNTGPQHHCRLWHRQSTQHAQGGEGAVCLGNNKYMQ